MSVITDFFAAFTISALAATGVGGGGFFVIYLTLIIHLKLKYLHLPISAWILHPALSYLLLVLQAVVNQPFFL